MTAYLKTEIPDRLHYRNNERVQPIILIADEGWTIVQRGNTIRCNNYSLSLINKTLKNHHHLLFFLTPLQWEITAMTTHCPACTPS